MSLKKKKAITKINKKIDSIDIHDNHVVYQFIDCSVENNSIYS